MSGPRDLFEYQHQRFFIRDCGGGGACLFKCLAAALDERDHHKVRKDIVNYVCDNWEERYGVWATGILLVSTPRGYRRVMGPSTAYGSELECMAAASLYNKRVSIYRRYGQATFNMSFGEEIEGDEIILLFTGMREENNRDGHYQLLYLEAINGEVERLADEMSILNSPISSTEDSEEETVAHEPDIPSKKRRVFQKQDKEMIARARLFFEELDYTEQHVQTTAKCLGISERSVVRISNEFCDNGGYCDAPRSKNSGRKKIQLDAFEIQMVREKIFGMYLRREFPTVKSVLGKLLQEDYFPKISEHTLRETLKIMKFKYRKVKSKPTLMKNPAMSGKRDEDLSKISHYRRDGFQIFYTDETWYWANHTRSRAWVQEWDSQGNRDNYDHLRSSVQHVDGFIGGFAKPSGAGRRVIICHIGSEDGFLDSGMDCFVGDKKSPDYHDEMNGPHYTRWLKKILHLLPAKSVIVIDQAPYHTMIDLEFRNPTTKWRRQQVIEWMEKRQVPLPFDLSSYHDARNKGRLLQLCGPYKYEKRYLLEKITLEERHGDVKLLWLPVAHCEFNPIEMIWAYVKDKVAKNNETFKVQDVRDLCIETMNSIPGDLWSKCVQSVLKLEQEYRGSESTLSDLIDNIVIDVNGDSDTSDSESDDDDV